MLALYYARSRATVQDVTVEHKLLIGSLCKPVQSNRLMQVHNGRTKTAYFKQVPALRNRSVCTENTSFELKSWPLKTVFFIN